MQVRPGGRRGDGGVGGLERAVDVISRLENREKSVPLFLKTEPLKKQERTSLWVGSLGKSWMSGEASVGRGESL